MCVCVHTCVLCAFMHAMCVFGGWCQWGGCPYVCICVCVVCVCDYRSVCTCVHGPSRQGEDFLLVKTSSDAFFWLVDLSALFSAWQCVNPPTSILLSTASLNSVPHSSAPLGARASLPDLSQNGAAMQGQGQGLYQAAQECSAPCGVPGP